MANNKTTAQYLNQTAAIFGGGLMPSVNTPTQYGSRQTRYMADRTERFVQARAYLASDFVKASVQGLTDDFYDYTSVDIRLADVSTANITAFDVKKGDDFKQVLFPPRNIDYFPLGAKLVTMGSTWLCINPYNMSNPNVTAIIARCNATYNSYDEYGNIVVEPIVIQKTAMLGNRNESPLNLVLMSGYYTVTCQLNANTAKLGQNQRIILGTKAYHITGFTDFIQEFTGDRESVRILTFTARIEEPTVYDDTTDTFIANGKSYSFGANINGTRELTVGQTTQLTAVFNANGEKKAATADFPLTWLWESDTPSVASIDGNGFVIANSVGTATITAKLAQNGTILPTLTLTVLENQSGNYVAFFEFAPHYIEQYDGATIEAAYYASGVETNEPLHWSFAGADTSNYIAQIAADGKSVTISCLGASDIPLLITASSNGATQTIQVTLEGY